jgi:hypothetical protein
MSGCHHCVISTCGCDIGEDGQLWRFSQSSNWECQFDEIQPIASIFVFDILIYVQSVAMAMVSIETNSPRGGTS